MHPSTPGGPFLAKTVHGRGPALERLEAFLGSAADPRALALVGAAGIGKTRLAEWASQRAGEAGLVVLEGHTTLGLSEPLGLFCDLVRWAQRSEIVPRRADALAAGFPAQILPELGADASEAGNLGATFEAAGRYLRALAGRTGVLAVLEDLHWADATSLSLVGFLARTLRGAPVSLLLTFRPDDDRGSSALEELRTELRRSRIGEELPLGPLEPRAAAAMLREMIGRAPAPDVEAELLRLSAGNPFALEELTRAAVDSGWLDLASGRRLGTTSVHVPWTLTESIRARATRLAPPHRDVLGWAATIGERFDVRLLAAAADLPARDALAGVAALVDAGLAVESPGDRTGQAFAFRHVLVFEALAGEGLLALRRERHGRVLAAAEALAHEGLAISASEMAGHALAAGDRPRTIAYSRAAVERAQELGAVEEAIVHLERALALWEEEDGRAVRAELLLACGRLRSRLEWGDRRAVELLEEAYAADRPLAPPRASAWCRAALAEACFRTGDRPRALALWEEAIPELRRDGDLERLRAALVDYAAALALTPGSDPARVAEEALALVPEARTAEEASQRVSLLTTLGSLALFDEDLDAARWRLREASALALEHHDDLGAARAHYVLGIHGPGLTPPPEAVQALRTAAELVGRHGLRSLEATYTAGEALILARAGDWATADRRAEAAEALVEDELTGPISYSLIIARAWSLLARGDLDAARLLVDDWLAVPWVINFIPAQEDGWTFGARLRNLAGDADDAYEFAAPMLARMREPDYLVDPMHLVPLAPVIATACAADDLELFARLADDCRHTPWIACTRSLLAIAGGDDTSGPLEAVTAGLHADGHRLEAALIRVAAAMLLSGRPEARGGAIALARAAHAGFSEMGSDGWCRRVEGMLRRLGERAPTPSGAGAGPLSRRELEVLQLLAEGLTNRAIAERLVISEHTAIRHVANIFRKLGASSRAAAVRLAAEQALLAGGAEAVAQE